jgi:hypothetical protein
MSLFKKIGKALKKVGKVGMKAAQVSQAITNPAAYAMQMSYTGAGSRMGFAAPPQYSDYGSYGGQNMSLIRTSMNPPRLGQTLRRGGLSLAKKIPGGIGTAITAGAILYDSFGNPVARAPKRHRAKGITASQLKAFTRVTHILDKYCKVKPPGGARRTTHRASRSKTCR